MRNRLITTIAAGVALATMTAGAAHAVPSYAYASLAFTNFALGGVFGAPGVTVQNTNVTSTDGSNYPVGQSSGHSDTGNVTTGTDPLHAKTGPGAFPPENTFTQALLPALASTPAGTRGDALITGPLATGANSNLVAEGKLVVPNSSAGSSSGTNTTIGIKFTAAAGAGPITLNFSASSKLQAIVGASGDSAGAQFGATFEIFDATAGSDVFITSNNANAASGEIIAPTNLNRNQATNNPAIVRNFSSGPTTYSFTSDALVAGHMYEITLQDSTTIILSTGSTTAIPEPASLALLGSGIMGIGLLRSRRNKKA